MKTEDSVVIDAHVHTYPSLEIGRRALGGAGFGPFGTINELLSMMDRTNISQSVMSSLVPVHEMRKALLAKRPKTMTPAAEERFTLDTNAELVARIARRNRWACEAAQEESRLISLISVDVLQSPEQMVADIEGLVTRFRAKGLKVHPVMNEYYPGDERLWPAYGAAQRMGIPVLFHSGAIELPGYTNEFGRVGHFRKVAERFPDLQMILAHLGKGEYDESIRIAEEHPNVFFDTAGCFLDSVRPREEVSEELVSVIRKIGIHRVMFGSDWPWHDPGEDIAAINRLSVTELEKEMILGSNAKRIFGI